MRGFLVLYWVSVGSRRFVAFHYWWTCKTEGYYCHLQQLLLIHFGTSWLTNSLTQFFQSLTQWLSSGTNTTSTFYDFLNHYNYKNVGQKDPISISAPLAPLMSVCLLSLFCTLSESYTCFMFFLSIVLLLPYIQDGYVEVHTFRMEFLFIKRWKTTAKTCQAKWKKTLNWQKVSIAFSHFIQNRERARVWAGEKRRVTQLFFASFFLYFHPKY